MIEVLKLIALSAVIGGIGIVVAFVIYVIVVFILTINKEKQFYNDAEQANKDSVYKRAQADAIAKQAGSDLDVTRSLL